MFAGFPNKGQKLALSSIVSDVEVISMEIYDSSRQLFADSNRSEICLSQIITWKLSINSEAVLNVCNFIHGK